MADERFACLEAVLGKYQAEKLARAGWSEVLAACASPDHPVAREMEPRQYEKLRAMIRLGELYFRSRGRTVPSQLGCLADVVQHVRPRCHERRERLVWLLVLDEDGDDVEVLVQYGGHPSAPPPVKTMLRLAIARRAAAFWVVDFRPGERVELSGDVVTATAALARLCAVATIELRDYLLLAREDAVSVRDAVSLVGVEREAA